MPTTVGIEKRKDCRNDSKNEYIDIIYNKKAFSTPFFK